MRAAQLRVVDEEKELSEKLAKLEAFFEGPLACRLEPLDRQPVQEQMIHMRSYQAVLRRRLQLWTR